MGAFPGRSNRIYRKRAETIGGRHTQSAMEMAGIAQIALCSVSRDQFLFLFFYNFYFDYNFKT